MNEFVTCLPRLLSQNLLHLLETQLTQLLNIPYLSHNSFIVPRRDSGHRAKYLLSSIIYACACLGVVVRPERNGFDSVRLRIIRF